MTATITRAYDGLDRLTQEVTAQGTVTYTYDNANRRATMTVAGQPQVTYTYDNANRMTQIQQGTATATYTYDDADRRTSVTLPTGTSINYTYDAASQLTALTYKQGATTLGTLTYTYDRAGNRLTQGGTFARSNITLAASPMVHNANNQVTTFAATTLAYDLNGNLTGATDASGTATYTWNARNQLVGIAGVSFSASFAYDSLGRRTAKTINGGTTNYLYDGLNVVQEKNGAAVLANLLMGLGIDEVLTRTEGTDTRGFLPDALGSTIALIDNTGIVQTQYTYEPFGAVNRIGAASQNSYTYTGREDDGSGLYYYRARYYHPRLQRFISEDPIGFAGGDINLYGYVMNAPTMFLDPLGLVQQRENRPHNNPINTTDDDAAKAIKKAINDRDPDALNRAIKDLDNFIRQYCRDNPARAKALRGVLKLAKELRGTLMAGPAVGTLLNALLPDDLNAGELDMMNARGASGKQPCPCNEQVGQR